MSGGVLRAGGVIDGRYTLERKLGTGATGAVWLATDGNAARSVALKILHPKLSHDRGLVAQLAREASILAQLDDPNIARCYEVHTGGEFIYLVMEVVQGRPLSDEMSERTRTDQTFKIGEIAALFGPLCRAIEHAHRRMIVHRDLKPQNVMLTSRAPIGIKVLDFGIARLLEGNPFDATTMGRQLGSLFYMSPEQARGERADERSDVFALGSILFELLTLRRAWAWDEQGEPIPAFAQPIPASEANSLATVFSRLGNAERPRPTTYRRDLPLAIDDVVQRALAIAPGDRYSGPLPFLEAVQDSLQSVTAKDEFLTTVLPEAPPPSLPMSGEATRATDQALTQAMDVASAEPPPSPAPRRPAPVPVPELVEPGPTVRDAMPFLSTQATPSAPVAPRSVLPTTPIAVEPPPRTYWGLLVAVLLGLGAGVGLLQLTRSAEQPAPVRSAVVEPEPEAEGLLSRAKAGDQAAAQALWARIEQQARSADDPELRRRLSIYIRFRGTSRESEGLEGSLRVLDEFQAGSALPTNGR